MPVLLDVDRLELRAKFMRQASDRRDARLLAKPDLLAAVQAADGWANANAASFNAALPLPARTALTGRQKAELLMFVIRRRWEVS